MTTQNGRCVICGKALSEDNPGIPILGWARDLVGTDGIAHYLCISRLANETGYARGATPWSIGRPHPALVDLVERRVLTPCRVFEPGPGHGDNALYLASHGFDVTAADISPTAISILRARAVSLGVSLNVIQAEVIYGLDSLADQFDVVFERSFLQTLPPQMRPRYVQRIVSLLRDEGQYVGIIRGPRYPPPNTQPYAFSRQDLTNLFERHLTILEITPTVSGHGENELSFWLTRARPKR